MRLLQDRVAIITGAASGIGAAMARTFASEGATVIAADIDVERAQRVTEAIGPTASVFHADVSREEDIRALVDHTVEKHGRLDCMINNAGDSGTGGPIEKVSVAGFERTFDVLVKGVFLGMRYAALQMKRQRFGNIINTASTSGMLAGYSSHAYSAAKAAVIQLTKSVALELGELGIRVNCVCPGAVLTPIFATGADMSTEQIEKAFAPLGKVLSTAQPLPRAGMPEDIAAGALWLASDAASFVNGHALVIDGGLTAGQLWRRHAYEVAQYRKALEFGRS